MIDCSGPLYAENEIELSWPIWLGTIYDKDQTRQWLIMYVYIKIEIELSRPIK